MVGFLSLRDNESIFLDKTKYQIAQKGDVQILEILTASKYLDVPINEPDMGKCHFSTLPDIFWGGM
jgi:hypothetical protein